MRKAAVVLACLALSVLGYSAQWQGYWAGKAPIYRTIFPDIDNYDEGIWEEAPICWELVNTPVHLWTPEEILVVRIALDYWKEGVGLFLGEWFDPICAGRPVDVRLAWESSVTVFRNHGDRNNDGLPLDMSNSVGYYVPQRTAPPLKVEPCPDLQVQDKQMKCSTIFLKFDNPATWFVDPTPQTNEEFEEVQETRCGAPRTALKAKPDSPASGKQDLLTVVAHEFGHALGFVHSGGCDEDPRTGAAGDDDGRLMWEGYLTVQRDFEDIVVGLDKRRLPSLGEPCGSGLGGLEPSLELRFARLDLALGEQSLFETLLGVDAGCDAQDTALEGEEALKVSPVQRATQVTTGALKALQSNQASPAFFAPAVDIAAVWAIAPAAQTQVTAGADRVTVPAGGILVAVEVAGEVPATSSSDVLYFYTLNLSLGADSFLARMLVDEQGSHVQLYALQEQGYVYVKDLSGGVLDLESAQPGKEGVWFLLSQADVNPRGADALDVAVYATYSRQASSGYPRRAVLDDWSGRLTIENLAAGNSATPPDRDQDGVPDADDFCPDFPGKPATNGC